MKKIVAWFRWLFSDYRASDDRLKAMEAEIITLHRAVNELVRRELVRKAASHSGESKTVRRARTASEFRDIVEREMEESNA